MELRSLGRSGVKVSPLCLGAMMFGAWGETDHDACIRIIHRALDAGINFVDTADVYAAGEAEEIVGKALRGRRDDVVLATKFHGPMGDDRNRRGTSRRWIVRAVEDSLRRLGTDCIDLYQVHRPEPDVDIDETLGALTDLVRAGKVRYLGSSTFPAHAIVEAQWTAQRRNRERFVCEQPPYSMLVRGVEADVLPVCEAHGMGVICPHLDVVLPDDHVLVVGRLVLVVAADRVGFDLDVLDFFLGRSGCCACDARGSHERAEAQERPGEVTGSKCHVHSISAGRCRC